MLEKLLGFVSDNAYTVASLLNGVGGKLCQKFPYLISNFDPAHTLNLYHSDIEK